VGATGDDASASPTLSQVQERTAQLQQALNFEVILKRITDKVRDSLDEGQILQTAVQELACLSLTTATRLYTTPDQTTATICYEYTTLFACLISGLWATNGRLPEVFDQLRKVSVSNFMKSVPTPSGIRVQHWSHFRRPRDFRYLCY